MWLRSFGCIATARALGASGGAIAQSKAYRIGWLRDGSPPSNAQSSGDFQQGLRDVGYVDGRNVTIDYRYASGNVDRLPQLATELVRVPVDVIVTSGLTDMSQLSSEDSFGLTWCIPSELRPSLSSLDKWMLCIPSPRLLVRNTPCGQQGVPSQCCARTGSPRRQ